jgi:hypothetical protein
MSQQTFEEFIGSTLEIVNEFAETNKLRFVYGFPNKEQYPYLNTKSPINDELIYSLIGPSQGTLCLRFTKLNSNQFHVFIDNSQISLMLDQDIQRLTDYPNEELNLRIDNIIGNTKDKLTTCLYILWDITCFIVFLSRETKK